MGEASAPRPSFWGTAPGILTAVAAIITAIGGLVGALAAAGVFDREDEPDPEPLDRLVPAVATEGPDGKDDLPDDPAPDPLPDADPLPDDELAPVADRVDVDLVYPGDPEGCGLFLTVRIGDATVQPRGTVHTMSGVPVGAQDYSASGSIICPASGQCQAEGGGVLRVTEGATYEVVWRNTGFGVCEVLLQP